jgi:hypothetical protein
VGPGNVRTEIEVGITKQADSSDLINFPTVRAIVGLSEWADLEFEYGFLSYSRDYSTTLGFSRTWGP